MVSFKEKDLTKYGIKVINTDDEARIPQNDIKDLINFLKRKREEEEKVDKRIIAGEI